MATARSFGFLPRQAMFFLKAVVENNVGKRTNMTLFKGVSSAFSGAMCHVWLLWSRWFCEWLAGGVLICCSWWCLPLSWKMKYLQKVPFQDTSWRLLHRNTGSGQDQWSVVWFYLTLITGFWTWVLSLKNVSRIILLSKIDYSHLFSLRRDPCVYWRIQSNFTFIIHDSLKTLVTQGSPQHVSSDLSSVGMIVIVLTDLFKRCM